MAINKLMHAVQYDKFGGGAAGLKHVEVPVPSPKDDEVLIKLEAVSINPVDWKIQNGVMRFLRIPPKFPYSPVSDVAGEIVEVGQGVTTFNIGDKVVAFVTYATGGGLSEFAVAKESMIAPRPLEVSAAQASGIPVAAVTALKGLAAAGIKLEDQSEKQKNVLITAASGGVGHYAVQLAKLRNNTHVTATCGARNIEFVKKLGADEVLDYKTPDGQALKSPSGRKYDAVVHCTSGIPWSTFERNLSGNGKVIDLTPGPSTWMRFAFGKLTLSKKLLRPLIVMPKGDDLDRLVKLMNDGKFKTFIDSIYPLSKAEDAWAKSITGHATGKIVVEN
ncbi:hypothetical protein ACFE04_029107 [Oxalis oulophora]